MSEPDPEEVQRRLDAAVALAQEAGEITLELFRADDIGLERKGDGSPVTLADRRAEEHLRARIGELFPTDAVLGEEFGETAGTSGFQWVLDPIDGTKSFVSGVPLYTTLVGVLHGEASVAGVIHAAATGETASARLGGGAEYRVGSAAPQPARVSSTARLEDAVFVTSEVLSFTKSRERDARPAYDKLQDACRVSRTWGDGYGYMLVATGRVDIALDPVVNLWDVAALMPVIIEAGGVFTDWQGRATVHSPDTVATNPQLAESVLAILKDA